MSYFQTTFQRRTIVLLLPMMYFNNFSYIPRATITVNQSALKYETLVVQFLIIKLYSFKIFMQRTVYLNFVEAISLKKFHFIHCLYSSSQLTSFHNLFCGKSRYSIIHFLGYRFVPKPCLSLFMGSYTNHPGVESNLVKELLKILSHTRYLFGVMSE